jgi:hypothetical protein
MARLRYNGLATGSAGALTALALGGSLTSSGTTITFSAALTYQNGTAVPTITGSDFIPLSILDASGNLSEVVYLTAYTAGATTGTITRGQEGTTGVAHSSGDKVVHAPTVFDVGRDRRWTVGTGETSIDEFNDSTLDAAWVRVDSGTNSGSVAWLEDGDVLTAKHTSTSDGTAVIHALLRPLSGAGGSMATGDAFVTCGTSFPYGLGFAMGGLLITDGTTYASGKQVGSVFYTDSAVVGYSHWCESHSGFNTQVTNSTDHNVMIQTAPMWMRLVYLGSNNWRADTSIDGIAWWTFNSTVSISSFTPTHVGFLCSNWNSTQQGLQSYECLRRVSGIT